MELITPYTLLQLTSAFRSSHLCSFKSQNFIATKNISALMKWCLPECELSAFSISQQILDTQIDCFPFLCPQNVLRGLGKFLLSHFCIRQSLHYFKNQVLCGLEF